MPFKLCIKKIIIVVLGDAGLHLGKKFSRSLREMVGTERFLDPLRQDSGS